MRKKGPFTNLCEYLFLILLQEDCTSDSVRRANNLAREIESSANYQINVRHELDESVDDETKFSAVDENAPSNDQKGKYIPPSRREVVPTPPLNGAKSSGAGVPKGGPVPAGGSTGQVAASGGRNMSRNNSESEGKNKNRNQTSNSQKNQQSSSPMGGVKGGKDGKKDNRNRSSPISQSNNSKSQSSNQPRGPQPQQQQPSQSRPSQPSQQGMAWNRIAGGGASNNNSPASPVTGATKRSTNQNTTPNNPTNNVDNRKKTGEDLKKFSSNFLLPSDEKNSKSDNQTQNNLPEQHQGAVSQSDQSVQNMPNNLGQPNMQQQPNQTQQPQTQTKRKTTPPPGLDKKQTGPPPGMSQKQPEQQKTESEKAPETPKVSYRIFLHRNSK